MTEQPKVFLFFFFSFLFFFFFFLKLRDFVTRQQGREHRPATSAEETKKPEKVYFFGLRVAQIWNSLPLCVMRAQTVHTFKCRLDKH